MSDWLLNALREAFVAHGLEGAVSGGALALPDQLRLEPRVLERDTVNGTAQVRVDFAIQSPRLVRPLLDSFAGVGATREDAEQNAFRKFLQGSFPVVAEALTSHRCDGDQVDWEDWNAPGHGWRVCGGPVLTVATRSGAHVEGFPEFYENLQQAFTSAMPPGPHWMRLFVGSMDHERLASEVLVDGAEWAYGQELVAQHEWTFPAGYASLRQLMIALPR